MHCNDLYSIKFFMGDLNDLFESTISPSTSELATIELYERSNKPSFIVESINLLSDTSTSVPAATACSIFLKRLIEERWVEDLNSSVPFLNDDDKNIVRGAILEIILATPYASVRRQLVETSCIIGGHDYPSRWPNMVENMTGILQVLITTNDIKRMTVMVEIMEESFTKYRSPKTQRGAMFDREVDMAAESIAPIQLECMHMMVNHLASTDTDADFSVAVGYKFLNRWLDIFTDLIWYAAPIAYIDNMEEYVDLFVTMLKSDISPRAIVGPYEDDSRKFYSNKNRVLMLFKRMIFNRRVDFTPKIYIVFDHVFALLKDLASVDNDMVDNLVVTALGTLGEIVSAYDRVTNVTIDSYEFHRDLIVNVILPYTRLTPFDMNRLEFFPMDKVGETVMGDTSMTKRSGIKLLLRRMYGSTNWDTSFLPIMHEAIGQLLSGDNIYPLDLETALYLFVNTIFLEMGENQRFPTQQSMFNTVVIPYLEDRTDVEPTTESMYGILACFRYITTCRNLHLDTVVYCINNIIPDYLCDIEHVAISSGASLTLSKIFDFFIYDNVSLTENQISLDGILAQSLGHISTHAGFENKYVSELVMQSIRLYSVIGPVYHDVTWKTIASTLKESSVSIHSPEFSHHLFESISLGISMFTSSPTELLSVIGYVYPVLKGICSTTDHPYVPYCIQLFEQMLIATTDFNYTEMVEFITDPEMWKSSGTVEAMVPLVDVYLQRTSDASIVEPVLYIVDTILCPSFSMARYGFDILVIVLRIYDNTEYFKAAVKALDSVSRWDKDKIDRKVATAVGRLVATLWWHYPSENVLTGFESLYPGLTLKLIGNVLEGNLLCIISRKDRKLLTAGLSNLLVDPTFIEHFSTVWESLYFTVREIYEGRLIVDRDDTSRRGFVGQTREEEYLSQQDDYSKYSKLRFKTSSDGAFEVTLEQPERHVLLVTKHLT